MKIYIDINVYSRKFDDQSQPRIELETLGLNLVLQLVFSGAVEVVSSTVLDYENSRNSLETKRDWIESCLKLAKFQVALDDAIIERGRELEEQGLKTMDALHVACAEAAECEYFLTCDKRLIRRYPGAMKIINPANFILELTGEE